MTQGRLYGRIQRMGRQSAADTTAASEPSSSGAPGRRSRAGRTGTGASSLGGTPATAPGLQSDLTAVTDAASDASGAVSSPNGGGAASPPGPQVMPMQAVIVGPTVGTDYVTLGAQDLRPLITADGAAVPATAPGRWGQVVAAGRP